MKTIEELKKELLNLDGALIKCFGEDHIHNDPDGHFTVDCCGDSNIQYGFGIIGMDIVRCRKCNKSIINILSPHTSPILIDLETSTTGIPSLEFIDEIGDQCWMIHLPEEQSNVG